MSTGNSLNSGDFEAVVLQAGEGDKQLHQVVNG